MSGGRTSVFQVPFNAVALRVTHSDVAPTHIMYALNASWVGLCRILDDVTGYSEGPVLLAQTPICDCLGFGELCMHRIPKVTALGPWRAHEWSGPRIRVPLLGLGPGGWGWA